MRVIVLSHREGRDNKRNISVGQEVFGDWIVA
jgi:hypothetical protein